MNYESYYDRLLTDIETYITALPDPEAFWDWVVKQVGLEKKLRLTHSAIWRYRDIHLLEALIERHQNEHTHQNQTPPTRQR